MNLKPLNIELLKTLCSFQSISRTKELKNFVKYLTKYLSKYDVEVDEELNIYVTKGNSYLYPCIVAHTDINQSVHKHLEFVIQDGFLCGYDKIQKKQVGCGFDDKVGVCMALQLLEEFDNIKLFLPANEEIGCVGSSNCNMAFFDNVSFIIQPDRNSKKRDFIYHTNGVETCSNEFIDFNKDLLDCYGYTPAHGTCTDIGQLKINGLDICAVNLSCGYFNEHSDKEVLNIKEAEVCYNLIRELIEDCSYRRWEHVIPVVKTDNLLESLIYEIENDYTISNPKILNLVHDYYSRYYAMDF